MVLLSLLLLLPIASSLSNFPIVSTSYGKVRGYEYRAKNGFVGEIFKFWCRMCATFFSVERICDRILRGLSESEHLHFERSTSSCPVILYIHGGVALFDGTMMFADEALITNFASVIMVTTEYRLGVFGVMALGDENVLPANIAIHDVLEALRFTRKEIHNFGGDKDQISIMGHSTGATIVLTMSFSPGINKPGEPPLFARAIAMSGSTNYEDEEKQVKRSHDVAAKLGCEGSAQEIVDCMLPISTEKILDVAFKTGGLDVFSKTQLNDLTMAGELMPIENVKELREKQKVTKLMLGTTLYEMEMKPFNTSSTVNNEVNLILGVKNEEECTQKYFADKKSGKFVSQYSGQSQAFFVTKWLFSEAQTKAGGEVYLYQYDYPAHAIHTDDVSYVMGFHDHAKDVNEEWLSRTYPIYFANFAKGLPPAPDWTPVVPELMNYYSVNKSFTDGVSPEMKTGYHRDIIDYYKGIVQYDDNLSKIKKKLLNAPVQYKELIVLTTERVNIRDILFYSIILGVLLFLVFKSYQCWRERQRSAEESPLLIDRLNNNE
ncbi:hypothetical protein PRIPAC_79189 [Pristionchus pacificus]|uniref:Carboxylic ester hydrolase n=1 Tax=Pristionchus pacificus TaxID=54126 RepID=A0A2A6CBC4_PRIPA|nr:hypothetical protein PRIPAC_79189 [Pristionchus pacificus]|eukprot:PDM75522.1 hydrolase [Pristionchus pacificus]